MSTSVGQQGTPVLDNAAFLLAVQVDQVRRGLRPASIEARRKRLAQFARWLEPRQLLEATTEDVQQWLDSLELTTGAWRSYLTHLHQAYQWAHNESYLERTPTATISRPRRVRRSPLMAQTDLARALSAPDIGPAMVEARRRVPQSVRQLMVYYGVTTEDMALAFGKTRQTIHNKLSGQTKLSHDEVVGLADLFGVPIDLLREGPDSALRWVLDHPDDRVRSETT